MDNITREFYPNIAENVTVGDGQYNVDLTVYPYSTIEHYCTIEQCVVIGSNVFVGRGTHIGHGTRIQHGAFICRNAVIGSNVFIGPLAVLTDDKYPRVNNPYYEAQPPILECDCSIGAGAVILPGVRIGKGAMIGAGAVVTHDILPGVTVIGIPAGPVSAEVPKTTSTGGAANTAGYAIVTDFEGFGIP